MFGWLNRNPDLVIGDPSRPYMLRWYLIPRNRWFLVTNDQQSVWTLFLTGPKVRTWGFWCPKGFVPWFDFVKPEASGEVGRGCGEDESS